jgi:hypothetical protein
MSKRYLPITIALIFIMLISACNFPQPTPETSIDTLRTAAALTVAAISTQIATSSVSTDVPTKPQPTELPPTQETPQASNTPLPSSTPTTAGVCDRASFIEETIPDNSDFFPSSTFKKTWTLKNIGTCTWTSAYAVVFTSGNSSMNAPATLQLTNGSVAPGESVVVSMNLTAPASVGTYKAEFKLRNAEGVIFGFGETNRPFWAEIDVVTDGYDMVKNMCAAEWVSGAGVLDCPGKDGSSNGFVYADSKPKIEGNYQDDEPALWMAPQQITNGYIKGTFPTMKMLPGMVFRATIGCAPTAVNCDVVMTLNWQEEGQSMQTLAIWYEVNDGIFQPVYYDLGALANRTGQLILIVDAHGSASGDKVHWLMPILE